MGVGETVALRADVHPDCSLVRMNLGSVKCSVDVKKTSYLEKTQAHLASIKPHEYHRIGSIYQDKKTVDLVKRRCKSYAVYHRAVCAGFNSPKKEQASTFTR